MEYKIEYKTLKIAEYAPETFIKSPDLLFDCIKEDFSPLQESMILIGLNVKNRIVYKKIIAMGGTNTMTITPKEIFTHLLLIGASNFIIAHNHPSGDIIPSKEDIVFTRKLHKAAEIMGLNFLDHIIYTDKEYNSLKQGGLI